MNNSHRRTLQQPPPSNLLAEYWGFLRQSGKWWLFPILVVTLDIGAAGVPWRNRRSTVHLHTLLTRDGTTRLRRPCRGSGE